MVSVTERVKTLFFSPLQPRNAGGGGGGRGRGGGGGVFPCLPPGDFFRTTKKGQLALLWWLGPRGPGPKPTCFGLLHN